MLLMARLRGLRVLVSALTGKQARCSSLRFWVSPFDVDLNVHLTNSRYYQLMDVGRMDLLLRSGLGRELWRASLAPMVVEQHLSFEKELPLGATVELTTRCVGKRRKAMVFEQVFCRVRNDQRQEAARAEVVVLFVGGDGVVDPSPWEAQLLPRSSFEKEA